MKKSEFLLQLDDVMAQLPGTVKGNENLTDLHNWTSLASVAFVVMADDHFGASLSGETVARCKTVQDLIDLFPGQITDG